MHRSPRHRRPCQRGRQGTDRFMRAPNSGPVRRLSTLNAAVAGALNSACYCVQMNRGGPERCDRGRNWSSGRRKVIHPVRHSQANRGGHPGTDAASSHRPHLYACLERSLRWSRSHCAAAAPSDNRGPSWRPCLFSALPRGGAGRRISLHRRPRGNHGARSGTDVLISRRACRRNTPGLI